ncbi:MAG: NAD(P)-dependent oxidoreductase [Thermoflexales bacterium]|nr:NAD(P)-dependent oxidoreductase [Thermoflexales bacterium]
MSTRVLITGGTGLLGQALLASVPADFELTGTYLPGKAPSGEMACPFYPLDVREPAQVAELFDRTKPDVVIHAASIGSVDYSEHHREESWAVNVGGTQNIGQACARHHTRLIFISSNAVFDGERPFYAEDAPVHPINYYGQLKVEGEQWVAASGLDYAIVRPILMYGWHLPIERGNWVTNWIRALGQGQRVKVVDDVGTKPLYALNCAEVIWAVIAQHKTGLYHAAGGDHITLYQFAQTTAEVFGLDATLIDPVPSSYFPEIAPRPKDTSFDTTKMERELGIKAWSVRDGLQHMRQTQAS